MCASCGCGEVSEDHGDYRRITLGTLELAAEADGSTVEKVAQNIVRAASNGAGNGPAAGQAQSAVQGEPRQHQVPGGRKANGEVTSPQGHPLAQDPTQPLPQD